MPDCNHSTASCSCVPATAGGGDQGGASCALGQQLLGWRHVDGGFCYIQTLPPTSVPSTQSTHTAGGLGTAGDTGQRTEVDLLCPMCPHPLDCIPTPLLLHANPHKDQSPSVK